MQVHQGETAGTLVGIRGWKSAWAWCGTRSPFKKEPLAEEQGTLHRGPFGGGCSPDGRMTVVLEPRPVNAGESGR